MKIVILHNGIPCDQPSEWPCVLSEDEPLAQDDTYYAIDELDVGQTLELDQEYSVRRVE